MHLRILAASRDALHLWIPRIVVARNIAFRNAKRSIRGADRLHVAAMTSGGDQQGSNSLQFIRFVLNVDDREALKLQPLWITSFHTRATPMSSGMSRTGRHSVSDAMITRLPRLMADGEGDLNLWNEAPWTGRAVKRARCQNEPRGVRWPAKRTI